MKSKCVLLLLLIGHFAGARQDSIRKPRAILVGAGATVVAAGSLTYLWTQWYKDYPSQPFHFFNDNAEWNQMDKIGHSFTTYQIARIGYNTLRWTGMSEKKSMWTSTLTGWGYLAVIELMDGRSAGWGFSWGDMAANTAGSALFVSQQMLWKEQRVHLKFSFQPGGYAQYRPSLLGSTLPEQILKDYNGQTYWLSCSPARFTDEAVLWPEWLQLSLGYGSRGMIGGHFNPPIYNDQGNLISFNRSREYYLSLDIDLRAVKWKSKFMKSLTAWIGYTKFPLPGLRYGADGFKGQWVAGR
jgi:uncharacterized protein YfiM (DUF2279 family)